MLMKKPFMRLSAAQILEQKIISDCRGAPTEEHRKAICLTEEITPEKVKAKEQDPSSKLANAGTDDWLSFGGTNQQTAAIIKNKTKLLKVFKTLLQEEA